MKTIWRKAGALATAAFLAAGYGLCEAAVPLSLSKSVEMALDRDESIQGREKCCKMAAFRCPPRFRLQYRLEVFCNDHWRGELSAESSLL